VSSAFGTVVVERIIDTFSFLLLVALLPLVYDGPLLDSFPWLQSAGLIITGVTAAGMVFLVAMMVRRDWTDRFLLRPLTWVLPEGARLRTEEQVHAFLDGFLFLKEPASFAVIVLSGVLVWFLYILMTYVALFAFGLGMLGPRAAVVVLTISSIGVAIPTPGSTGSYHAFASQTLIRLFAVDPSVRAVLGIERSLGRWSLRGLVGLDFAPRPVRYVVTDQSQTEVVRTPWRERPFGAIVLGAGL